MMDIFLTAVITYASLEVAYWYYRWLMSLKAENLPIVKALLFAVFAGQSSIFLGYLYHIIASPAFSDSIWVLSVLLARCLYMIPIWKQKIPYASPQSFLLRLIGFATLATLIGNYV